MSDRAPAPGPGPAAVGSPVTMPSATVYFQAVEWRHGTGAELTAQVHAKTYGTTLAACGLDATPLTKRWDLPFASSHPEACRLCVAALGWRDLGRGA